MKYFLSLVLTLLMSFAFVIPASADVVPDANELIFTAINGTTSPAQTVTVTNTGAAPIQITNVQIAGANPASYTLTNPPGGAIVVPAGGNTAFNITFNPPGGANGVHLPATLDITSTDPVTPVVNVGLHGLSLQGLEGANEPGLQAVVDTLGFDIDVGGAGLIIRPAPEDINPAPGTEEIYVELFERAGAGAVSIVPVARFSPAEALPYGYYFPNGTIAPPVVTVDTMQNSAVNPINHQTLNPLTATGTTTFDPGTFHFGFFVNSLSFGRLSYTQDALNTGPRTRAARIFTLNDRNGTALPNTYLLTYEDAANGDYQDYVYVLSNVTPAVATAPIATDDTATTTLNTPITVTLTTNDTGVDTNLVPATVNIVAPPNPAQGTLVNNVNGTVAFTPAAGFSGLATFTYTVQDAFTQTSNTATVQVQVNDNTPPVPPVVNPPVTNNTNTGQTVNTAPAQPTFTLTKQAQPAIATAGDAVTFVITMSNTGSDTYTNLNAEDVVPAEFEILDASFSAGSIAINGQTVSFNVPTLASGQTVTATINTRIRAGVSNPLLTNEVCAGANNLAATCTQATVLGVQTLPATGETPLWRILLMLSAGITLIAGAVWVGFHRYGAFPTR